MNKYVPYPRDLGRTERRLRLEDDLMQFLVDNANGGRPLHASQWRPFARLGDRSLERLCRAIDNHDTEGG